MLPCFREGLVCTGGDLTYDISRAVTGSEESIAARFLCNGGHASVFQPDLTTKHQGYGCYAEVHPGLISVVLLSTEALSLSSFLVNLGRTSITIF